MEPLASVEDLIARWRSLDDDEQAKAQVHITDASNLIYTEFKRKGLEFNTADELLVANAKTVACGIVRRCMSVAEDMAGVNNFSQGVGEFSFSSTYVNPNGDLYLTKGEKKLLGLSSQRLGAVRPHIGGSDDSW